MARSDMTVELKLTDAAKMLIAEAKQQLELNERQLAVIEAAKAWFAARVRMMRMPDSHAALVAYHEAATETDTATAALIAAEKVDE